jgi:glycosyltransferase involved in cell wall biosynthesis
VIHQKPRILLLSAYDANSHRYWHQGLLAHLLQYNWQVITLKDRYYAWRMGGNALSFKAKFDSLLNARYDLLIATSMTDLATLRGLYPSLARIPNLLYFHENQFAYPPNQHQKGLVEIQLRSIFSAVAADQILFNSKYNLHSFMHGVEQFVQQMPDGIPTMLAQTLADKAMVLPVPIKDDCKTIEKQNSKDLIEVVWNHRWEHDKGPEPLLELMRMVSKNHDQNIKFHILGQQFRQQPAAMKTIAKIHQAICLTLGYVTSRASYLNKLQSADIVLSTAHHDFQGIAMLEAVACGCRPIAPNRLVYPELYPKGNLYDSTPENPQSEAKAIYQLIKNHQALKSVQIDWHWSHLQIQYNQLFEQWLNQSIGDNS